MDSENLETLQELVTELATLAKAEEDLHRHLLNELARLDRSIDSLTGPSTTERI